jgi:hypothetical protein
MEGEEAQKPPPLLFSDKHIVRSHRLLIEAEPNKEPG